VFTCRSCRIVSVVERSSNRITKLLRQTHNQNELRLHV